MFLQNFRRDLVEGQFARPATLTHCLLNILYDTLPFLFWSKTCREVTSYEQFYRAAGIHVKCYIVGWHSREVFMVQPENRPKFYLMVPSWWNKYELSRGLLVPTRPLFCNALRVLIHELIG